MTAGAHLSVVQGGAWPGASSAWTVRSVSDVQSFAALRPEWTALIEQSAASSFNRWEWLFPWHRRIAPDRELRILTARDETGNLQALLPLCRATLSVAGRKVRRLSFLGETHVGSDFLDVVALPGKEEGAARAFAAYLRDTQADWDVLDLLDLDEKSPTIAVFWEQFRGRIRVQKQRFICPSEPFIPGETFDAFLRRTSRRDNYLRRKKWLAKQDGFRSLGSTRPDELAWPLAEFFRLHDLRWAAEGGSQGIKGPSVEAFHRDATRLLAEAGKLRLYTLAVGKHAVASVYGILDRGTFSYFQSGYDPAWASKSVGLVLVGDTFRDALESGCERYDFLRGTESYKADWVKGQRRTVALRIYPSDGPGALLTAYEEWSARARGFLKWVLPDCAVESVRRLRRKQAQI